MQDFDAAALFAGCFFTQIAEIKRRIKSSLDGLSADTVLGICAAPRFTL